MIKAIKNFLQDEEGMQVAEYMILGTVMGAGSIGAVKAVRDGQTAKFQEMTEALNVASDGSVGGG